MGKMSVMQDLCAHLCVFISVNLYGEITDLADQISFHI